MLYFQLPLYFFLGAMLYLFPSWGVLIATGYATLLLLKRSRMP